MSDWNVLYHGIEFLSLLLGAREANSREFIIKAVDGCRSQSHPALVTLVPRVATAHYNTSKKVLTEDGGDSLK